MKHFIILLLALLLTSCETITKECTVIETHMKYNQYGSNKGMAGNQIGYSNRYAIIDCNGERFSIRNETNIVGEKYIYETTKLF